MSLLATQLSLKTCKAIGLSRYANTAKQLVWVWQAISTTHGQKMVLCKQWLFYKNVNGRKVVTHFSIHRIEPSAKFWGNITKEIVHQIDPMLRKDKSIAWSKELTKKVNRLASGIIGLRNISRESVGSRNLQCYITFNNYMQLVA